MARWRSSIVAWKPISATLSATSHIAGLTFFRSPSSSTTPLITPPLPYHQQSVHRRSSHKLAKKFYGLFRVIRRIGAVAYELDLPAASQIHPIFHISLLKPCYGAPTVQTCPLPSLASDSPSPSSRFWALLLCWVLFLWALRTSPLLQVRAMICPTRRPNQKRFSQATANPRGIFVSRLVTWTES
ncbi:UNVERIFIED_CONTAM: hypothetical protein Sradi_3817100 [Sesamum radiatum]|uniref:Tf2-1-like SH3-like domain-containing protein n=1 Tax=Sesamum radiatum TaxID=300843 RepID=A0AAW2Q0U3_SESRA